MDNGKTELINQETMTTQQIKGSESYNASAARHGLIRQAYRAAVMPACAFGL